MKYLLTLITIIRITFAQYCSINEEFTECGTDCPDTCALLRSPNEDTRECTDQCIIGCQCIPGYVRNQRGTCIHENDCSKVRNYNLKKSHPSCSQPNEIFNKCGTACPDTCDNMNEPRRRCTRQCVIGCQCIPGYVRNNKGVCVHRKECPQTLNYENSVQKSAPTCPGSNEIFTECGTACPDTCANMNKPGRICTAQCVIGCQCIPGYVRNSRGICIHRKMCSNIKQIGNYNSHQESHSSCPGQNEIFTECGTACPQTCANIDEQGLMCTQQCIIGCQCKPGYVRNNIGDCIHKKECKYIENYRSLRMSTHKKSSPQESSPQKISSQEMSEKCPGPNEVFNSCGTACPETCDNMDVRMCTDQCVIGCQCIPDYVRNSRGICIHRKMCSKIKQIGNYNSLQESHSSCPGQNEIFTECGTACPQTCANIDEQGLMCTQQCIIGCQCKPGYVRNNIGDCIHKKECKYIENYRSLQMSTQKKRSPQKSSPQKISSQKSSPQEMSEKCPGPNEVFNMCGSACPETCDNMDNSVRMCTAQCVIGCQCIPDYVRDIEGICVPKKECKSIRNFKILKKRDHFCPGPNEVYTECGTACPETCANMDDHSRKCTQKCVTNVCQCIPDYVRNNKGICILKKECKRIHNYNSLKKTTKKGDFCSHPNEVFEECGTACPVTCDNMNRRLRQICSDECVIGCFCNEPYVRDLSTGNCISREECDKKHLCTDENELYEDCGTECPITCDNHLNPPKECIQTCKQGCFCVEPYIRDVKTNSCILPQDCMVVPNE